MVLLSFLLVLAAAVTLVIGLLNGGLGLIYASIACSLGAGAVLTIAILRSRQRGAEPAAVTPSPYTPPSSDDTAVVTPVSTSVRRQEPDDRFEGDDEELPLGRTPVATGRGDDDSFPIADYDDLKVTDILPLLPELEPHELEAVRAREAEGKNRSRVLGRIDMLTTERDWDVADDEWDRGADRDRDEEDEPALAERLAVPAARTTRRGGPAQPIADDLDDLDDLDDDLDQLDDDDLDADLDDDFDDFPIADYDELKVGEIMPLLPELDDDELRMVRQREERGPARAMVLARVNRLLGESAPPPPPPPPVKRGAPKKAASGTKRASKAAVPIAPAKGAAKRAAAKKAPVKKAAGKKPAAAATAKRATTAKRVTKTARPAKKR